MKAFLWHSVKTFTPVNRHAYQVRTVSQCRFHSHRHVHPHVLGPVTMQCIVISFSCQCWMSRIRREAHSLCTEAMKPIGLNFLGADPSPFGMSEIKPHVSGVGSVPISSTKFNTCANFSNNCNGRACNSANLHPSAPGALFIFLHTFFSFSPFSSSTTHSQAAGCVHQKRLQTETRLAVCPAHAS